MKISKVICDMVHVPFNSPVLWGSGRRPGATRLILQIETDVGITGLGETICLWDFVEPVLKKTLIPMLLGEDPHNIERITRKAEGLGLYHHKRALVAALCGIEIALWDIIGKEANLPLFQLLGGRYREKVMMSGLLHIRTPEEMAKQATDFVARGFKTIKAKAGLDPQLDIEIVKAIRKRIPAEINLRVDVNGGWTIGTAKRQIQMLKAYDLEYIEQPLILEDLAGHANLSGLGLVPIALDESVYTIQDTLNILRSGAADVFLIDHHESGGIWSAKKAAAIAEAAGIPCSMHGAGELGISTAARLHIAASTPNISLAVDSEYHNMLDDIITKPFKYENGSIAPPEGPGLGVELDPLKLQKYRIHQIIGAYGDPEKPDWFTVKPTY